MPIRHKYSPYSRDPSPPTTLPYRIRTLGRIHHQPQHSTQGTFHNDAMLTLFLGGSGVYLQGPSRVRVEAGMVGLVLPDAIPGVLMSDPDDPYDHFYCRFAGSEALRTARRIVAERNGANFFHWGRWQEGAEILRRMHLGRGEVEVERLRPGDAMLAELLAELDRPPAGPMLMLTARHMRSYLQDHLSEPNQLDAMARHFGVSKSHLCRVAKTLLGRTLVEAAEEGKMAWAQVLLREPSLSVAQVARRVGYSDPYYFSKVFKRHTGSSPALWRKT